MAEAENGAAEEEAAPRDAKVVRSILRSMGVAHYEPRVVNQFLDLWYRYIADVLGDAQAYADHAGKTAIDCDDTRLAVQARVNMSFSQPPPRETLLELAKSRNRIPLPKVIGGPGLALPPDVDTLISPNYQLIVPTRTFLNTEDMDFEQDDDRTDNDGGFSGEVPIQRRDVENRKVSFAISGRR